MTLEDTEEGEQVSPKKQLAVGDFKDLEETSANENGKEVKSKSSKKDHKHKHEKLVLFLLWSELM